MNKEEFLLKLREALAGEIPQAEIENHISYYRNYLSNDQDGKTEEQKLEELGEPRLIARTIIDAASMATESREQKNREYSYSGNQNTKDAEVQNDFRFRSFSFHEMAWYQKLLLAIIGVLIVTVLLGVLVLGVNLFFSLIVPILLVVLVVRLILNLTRR